MQGNDSMARSLGGRPGLGAGHGPFLGSRVLGSLVAAGLLAALAGCAAPPPPLPPTAVAVSLTASADVNAAAGGPGAPVQIRIYQLGSTSSFGNAEFFQLFNQDQATLGPDLIKRDDIILAPGQTTSTTLSPTDPVKAIGVFAAYRNFQQATWRATAPVVAHQTTTLSVAAGHDGITVTASPAGKPGS